MHLPDDLPDLTAYIHFTMPKHDLPDGREDDGVIIDFREYLQRRTRLSGQDNAGVDQEPDLSERETYRRAEYGDGKWPGFSRHDIVWIGLIIGIGWMLWELVLR